VSRNTHFRFNWATAQQFYCPTRARHRRWTPLNLLLALSQLHNLHLNPAAGFLVLDGTHYILLFLCSDPLMFARQTVAFQMIKDELDINALFLV
jgi:hypothetical protein